MATHTYGNLQRRALLLTAVLATTLGAGLPTQARTGATPVELTVVDRESGAALPFWSQAGRPFVAGDAGRRYGLRVSNRTGGRVLLVLSVDGVNVLTGETASYDQRGYVLGPHQTYDVNGWRKSDSEVAAFTFASLSDSYAARTGRPGDVGVIGMAVFRERAPTPPPPIVDDVRPSRRAAPGEPLPPPPPMAIPPVPPPVRQSPAAPASAPRMAEDRARAEGSLLRQPEERLGTGHGAREWSSVVSVEFVRATVAPQAVRRIEYDTARRLLARGVTPPYRYGQAPRPFPREPAPDGYVPDPPGAR